jgi:glycosyltransferase involved in cell wall biosynthesis
VPGGGGTRWEQRDLARSAQAANLDVLFSPAYTAPLRLGIPSVVALHDVSFAAHPEWYAWRHGLRLRWLARWSARRAHSVLTLTEFSAAEIRRHLGVPAGRIRVIPLAVDYLDTPAPARRTAPAVPVVLFAGSIFERRHLPLLIEGTAHARREVPDVRLDIIGENRTSPRQDLEGLARQHGVADALRLRDYVPDDELDAAYAGAGMFAFLSSYEGFGLTPLEAMRHGLPTVVLDTAVAREVYGTGARYVRPGDAASVGRAIVELLRDPVARAAQVAAGDAAVARYRWEDAARNTWDALVKAAGTAASRVGAQPTSPGRRR